MPAGEQVDAIEHASGIVREPGADRLAANGRVLRRAMEHGVDPRTMPLVVQYNKQDLPSELILPVGELSDAINFRNVPEFPADALHGPGVFETLRGISEIVLRRLSTGSAAPAAAK